MRTINNGDFYKIQVRESADEGVLELYQGEKAIAVITKDAAKELILIMKEFIDEPV